MASPGSRRALEWPTLALLFLVYGAWLALTLGWRAIPMPVGIVAAGVTLALHGSLQHEAVHGHPTRWPTIDAMVVGAPLSLWLPFALYRETHVAHHRVARLTDPFDDPESFYVDAERWRRASAVRRAWWWTNQTLLGRMVLGPPEVVLRFLWSEVRCLGRPQHARVWIVHALLVAAVLVFVTRVAGIAVHEYVLCFVWPGGSLALLRSFAEHRPAAERDHRSAVVESTPLFSLLFLHNNLHALHHAEPRRPWYELPRRYREVRETLLETNGGYFFPGYGAIARRWLVRPKDHPVHGGRPC